MRLGGPHFEAPGFPLFRHELIRLRPRRTAGVKASLLRLAGLDRPVPDHCTHCRRPKTLKVRIPYRPADSRFTLFVDSTGTRFPGGGGEAAQCNSPA